MANRLVMLNAWFPDYGIEERITREAGFNLGIHTCRTPDEIAAVAGDADGIVITLMQIDAGVLDMLPNCRVIGRLGVGLDNIDLQTASARGVGVINVPDYCTEEVAVHACSLLLALSRKLLPNDHLVRSGSWREWPQLKPMYPPSEQTLGLVGAGRIGFEVVKRMQPFGFRILVYDPYTNPSVLPEGVRLVGLDELLAASDLITIHCPLTPETRYLFNREAFAKMRPGAMLVNVSRGPIVYEPDLIEALCSRRLAGAALDVLQEEPPAPDHPIFQAPNVILTSHIAWYSETSMARLRETGMRRVIDYLQGRPVPTLVNGEAMDNVRTHSAPKPGIR